MQDFRLLALMESADPRLISYVGLLALYINSGLAGRGLTCLPSHFVVPCATFQRATSFVVRVSNRQPRLSGLADEVRLVRPVMGQQGPDCACRLVGQRDGGHVRRPPLGQAQRPFGWEPCYSLAPSGRRGSIRYAGRYHRAWRCRACGPARRCRCAGAPDPARRQTPVRT